jgi:tRNA A-37 threonylcarbamoyl transferase component Bud32
MLGRFRVLSSVGRGAMGVVYAAHDAQLDRKVALKILLDDRGEHASDEVTEGRLLREARSMARLAHPNIVTVFEVGVADGRVYLAMQLVEGSTLGEWLDADPPRDRVLALFVAVARALDAAHRAGVVHRDLKPQNILVSAEGEAKVTDFGLADTSAALAEDAAASSPLLTMTRTRGVVGTPAYMAPEVLMGARATALADQFSFGVCVHEALTGRRPYEARTLAELEERVRTEAPRVDASLDPALADVLCRALAREPSARFASMSDVASALERARDGVVRAPGTAGRGARSRRVALAALAALSGIAGLAGLAAVLTAGVSFLNARRGPAPAAVLAPISSVPASSVGLVTSAPVASPSAPASVVLPRTNAAGRPLATAAARVAPPPVSPTRPAPSAPAAPTVDARPSASAAPPPGDTADWLRSRR